MSNQNKSDNSTKAFDYEHGQYICHIYATISEDDLYLLESLVENIESKQNLKYECTKEKWLPIYSRSDSMGKKVETDEKEQLHITLLRGHRAVHYHQIRLMIDKFRLECETLQPVRLLLDRLTIFSNAERTKHFLCLTSAKPDTSGHSTHLNPLLELKQTIGSIVNQYAIRLTDEDETEDTVAHCSLMSKNHRDGLENESDLLQEIEEMIYSSSDDYPSCLVNIKEIHVKIGKKVHDIQLGGTKQMI